jgi:hypothetical protein
MDDLVRDLLVPFFARALYDLVIWVVKKVRGKKPQKPQK